MHLAAGAVPMWALPYVMKQHCRMAIDVCGWARMSRDVDKITSLPFKVYRNMHMQNVLTTVSLYTTSDSFI